MRILILIFALWLVVGCTGSTSKPVSNAIPSRTIQLGDATLFKSGDNWLYSFSAQDHSCFIVGIDVAYIDRTTEHLVVNLDLTETQKSSGLPVESHVLLNVSTSGHQQVLAVRPSGVVECKIDVPQQMAPDKLIQDVIANLKAENAE